MHYKQSWRLERNGAEKKGVNNCVVFGVQFNRRLTEEMTQKRWENTPVSQSIPTGTGPKVSVYWIFEWYINN